MRERKIQSDWLEQALINPQRREPDDDDPGLEHRLAPIAERDYRVPAGGLRSANQPAEGGDRALRPQPEGKTMRLTIDPKADALYLRLNEAQIVDSEQVVSGVVLDYDAQDNVVGVEMLNLSKRGNPVEIEKLVFETLTSRRPDVVLRETPPRYGAKPENDPE
jgi:uncharacterized protein YuzE